MPRLYTESAEASGCLSPAIWCRECLLKRLDASSSSFANAAYRNRSTHSALSRSLAPLAASPKFPEVLISLSATRVLVLRVCFLSFVFEIFGASVQFEFSIAGYRFVL